MNPPAIFRTSMPLEWPELAIEVDAVVLIPDNAHSHEKRQKPSRRTYRRCASLAEDYKSRSPPARPERKRDIRCSGLDTTSLPKVTAIEGTICRWSNLKISANNDVPPVLKRRLESSSSITLSDSTHSEPFRSASKWLGTKSDMADASTSLSMIKQALDSIERCGIFNSAAAIETDSSTEESSTGSAETF